jgi:SPP1 family phage portal protein
VQFGEEGQGDDLNLYFDTSFDEFVIDTGLEASKKSEAWAMAYMKNSELKFTLIPPEQLTPIYDEYGVLVTMIRTYCTDKTQVVLVYDVNEVKKYERDLKKQSFVETGTFGHYSTMQYFNGAEVGDPEQHGFGEVPFIPMYNNKERTSDLYNIKPLIDTYDIINSDFANNIDDMQDAYFTLKGYTGDAKHLGEFMKQLKMYKAIPVAEDGDMTAHQMIIPVEARKTFLSLLRQDIYEFAMAVDLKSMQGGSITNVYIKAMFADLDLKCNSFENEVRKFIFNLLTFINKNDGQKFTDEMTFNRSMIINQAEFIETMAKLVGILSMETIRELLPYDLDLEQEKERLEEEKQTVSLGLPTTKKG